MQADGAHAHEPKTNNATDSGTPAAHHRPRRRVSGALVATEPNGPGNAGAARFALNEP